MPRKKRTSAAARAAKARAANATATRESSHQQSGQQTEESVPEANQVEETKASDQEEDHTTSDTEKLTEMTPSPPPEDTIENADMPLDAVDKNVEDEDSQPETTTSADNVNTDVETDKTPMDTDTVATDNDDVEDERNYYVDTLLTDKSYLIDVALGYSVEENLKQPLKGFTTEDELQLFPVIESMSAKLYNIVQKMNVLQKKDVEAAMKKKKGIIKISDIHCKSYLCQKSLMEAPAETDKAPPSKRAPHPFLLTEDENMFSEDKLKMLRAVLDAGWKREVVMRSPGSTGRKTGDVYYYSPDGAKFRSSKQVEKHLAELRDSPFTIENFTFAKVRISTNPEQEIVRKAYDGKSPPRAPPKSVASKAKTAPPSKAESSKPGPKPSGSKGSPDILETHKAEETVKGVSSRRSIQPPKRYSGDAVLLLPKRSKVQDDKRNSNSNKGLMQMGMLPPKYPKGMEDSSSNLSESIEFNELGGSHAEISGSNSVAMKEIAEDSLFQISALRQSGGIDVDNMHQLVESQKQLAQKAAQAALIQEEQQQQGTTTGSSKRGITVIPCSIRCPGMEGAVPNLQCVRCLCLFHAECLGLPPNLAFNKYLCSNCTEQQTSTSQQTAAVNSAKNIIMKKSGEVKRSPPLLVSIPHGSLRGSVPGRDVTVTLAGKETLTRLPPHKVAPSSAGMARGIIRSRGMPPPHVRSPSTQVHPGHRVISSDGTMSMMGANPQMIKRGRGRPPSVSQSRPIPQLNKNLTITHLPRIPGAPPVPNLQPIVTPKALPGKLPMPMVGGTKPRQAIPAVPNLMKTNPFRLYVPPPSLSGRTFKKAVPPSHHHSGTNLRITPATTMVHKSGGIAYAPNQDRSVSLIKRYPQSVCTVGNKKFVVLPKRRPTEYSASTIATAVGNGGPPKGMRHSETDGMRRSETTIKKIVPVGEQSNCSDNKIVNDQPLDDGSNETDNINDTTPMNVDEDGLDIRTSKNESISAKQ